MIKTFMDCPDRTEYSSDDELEYIAGKVFCERYAEATHKEGEPLSMYCNILCDRKQCPRGFAR